MLKVPHKKSNEVFKTSKLLSRRINISANTEKKSEAPSGQLKIFKADYHWQKPFSIAISKAPEDDQNCSPCQLTFYFEAVQS